jgi:hypothetical protein
MLMILTFIFYCGVNEPPTGERACFRGCKRFSGYRGVFRDRRFGVRACFETYPGFRHFWGMWTVLGAGLL